VLARESAVHGVARGADGALVDGEAVHASHMTRPITTSSVAQANSTGHADVDLPPAPSPPPPPVAFGSGLRS
jgi:hypothetical protein